MTESRSDVADAANTTSGHDPAALAARLGGLLGTDDWSADNDTVRVRVSRDSWTDSIRLVRDEAELPFFSWLTAVDWSKEVAVGDGVDDPDSLEERFEVMCRLSSVVDASSAHIVADLPKDDAVIDSLVPLFGGAAWHEREAAEMFGITFTGHPNLTHLYLPDAFEGHPLRKSFALLSREVKPWPGMVDVEGMPEGGNPEVGDGDQADS